MLFQLNPGRYPNLNQYLGQLPDGLDSFAECLANTELTLPIRKQYPNLGTQADLPVGVRQSLTAPWRPNQWIPETVAMAQLALLRDLYEASDRLWLDGIAQRMMATFNGPMRSGMRIISPKLLIMAARERWSKLHRGTTLVSNGGTSGSHRLTLTYPPHLFNPLMLKGFAVSFATALQFTRATHSTVEPEIIGPQACCFVVTWSF